jgi:hypothetical protein
MTEVHGNPVPLTEILPQLPHSVMR